MGYVVRGPAGHISGLGQCAGPSAYWDPSRSPGEMSALAARLSRLAGELENIRARLAAATRLEWESKAAEAFRQEAALRAADLAAASSEVRVAGDYVAAYARVLESLAARGPGIPGG